MTVGPGITPDLLTLFLTTQPNRRSRADPAHRAMNRFYRRWGIAPRPEDVLTTGDSGRAIIRSSTVFRAWRDRPRRRFARWNASRGACFSDDCARIRGRRTRYEMRAGRRALLLFLALITWSPFSVQVSVLLFKTLLPRNTTAVGRHVHLHGVDLWQSCFCGTLCSRVAGCCQVTVQERLGCGVNPDRSGKPAINSSSTPLARNKAMLRRGI